MPKSKTLRCQDCDRPIVNRLIDNCLYCGEILTIELTFNDEQKDRLRKKEMRELEASRKARLEREDAQANTLVSGGTVDNWGLFFPDGI